MPPASDRCYGRNRPMAELPRLTRVIFPNHEEFGAEPKNTRRVLTEAVRPTASSDARQHVPFLRHQCAYQVFLKAKSRHYLHHTYTPSESTVRW
jgi:hypothetical protein